MSEMICIRTPDMPDWYHRALQTSSEISIPSGVFLGPTGECFFSGVTGSLLHDGTTPARIDLALDLAEMAAVARLDIQVGPSTHILYQPFEPESFALLWNERPDRVSGLPARRISLFLATRDAEIPVRIRTGHIGALRFENGQFVIRLPQRSVNLSLPTIPRPA